MQKEYAFFQVVFYLKLQKNLKFHLKLLHLFWVGS
ncbi:hypothetical protein cje96_05381 [Campylobacter jejuni subsp. jejuni LMG 23211]|nr:hypothetical protein cje96_05381 [Campylobacter jejuni subsp. jejuni LMG 23211]